MKRLGVYDPVICCSTGVCGTMLEPAVVRFAGDVGQWRRLQREYAPAFVNRPPNGSFGVEKLDNGVWEPAHPPHPTVRGDMLPRKRVAQLLGTPARATWRLCVRQQSAKKKPGRVDNSFSKGNILTTVYRFGRAVPLLLRPDAVAHPASDAGRAAVCLPFSDRPWAAAGHRVQAPGLPADARDGRGASAWAKDDSSCAN